MNGECENCGAELVFDHNLNKWICKICGWTPSQYTEDKSPEYIN